MIRGTALAAPVAPVALVALVALTGCNGGSDDAQTSTPDFCAAYNDVFDTVLSSNPNDTGATVRAFKAWANHMEQVGAPADMPDDARRGFEAFLKQAQSIDDDASVKDLEKLGTGASASDQADGEAFNNWTSDNCPLDLPSASPS